MQTYIMLLRGINVSGQKKMKMADLRTMLERLGLHEVCTYIQSGNVIFKSEEKNKATLKRTIEQAILATFGFDVPVLIKTRVEIKTILDNNPFSDTERLEDNKMYFVLLHNVPESDLSYAMEQMSHENEQFAITDACVYLFCHKGYGNAKCNNNLFERKLKVAATTRNYKTMKKLLEMAGG